MLCLVKETYPAASFLVCTIYMQIQVPTMTGKFSDDLATSQCTENCSSAMCLPRPRLQTFAAFCFFREHALCHRVACNAWQVRAMVSIGK